MIATAIHGMCGQSCPTACTASHGGTTGNGDYFAFGYFDSAPKERIDEDEFDWRPYWPEGLPEPQASYCTQRRGERWREWSRVRRYARHDRAPPRASPTRLALEAAM